MIVHDAGARYTPDGRLEAFWLNYEDGGRSVYRAISLDALRALPRSNRESPALIQRTAKALKAAYGAGIDLVIAFVGGVPGRGVVQMYGAAAESGDLEGAIAAALSGRTTVRAMFSSVYPQSRLEPPDLELTDWLRRSWEDLPYAVAFVGQPDPRDSVRSPNATDTFSRNGSANSKPGEYGLQQNEYVFRGMQAIGEPFVAIFIFSRLRANGRDLFALAERLRAEASVWRSRVNSTRGWTAGLALPMVLTGLTGEGAGGNYAAGEQAAISEGRSYATSESETWGRAETESWAHTKGTHESWGIAHTEGVAHTSFSSTTETWGNARTEGVADTKGSFESWGTATTTGSSWSTSTTTGVTTSASTTVVDTYSGGGNFSAEVGLGVFSLGGGVSGGHTWGTNTTTGVSTSSATTVSSGGFSSTTNSHSWGVSEAHTVSTADTTSYSKSVTTGSGVTHSYATTRSHSWGVSEAHTVGGATTTSYAKSVGESHGMSDGMSRGVGVSLGQALSATRAVGLGVGLAPSLSWSRVYQSVDYVADQVARVLEEQVRLLDIATVEGAYLVDAYALVGSQRARDALKGLWLEAFHGREDVVTPVQPVLLREDDERRIRQYAAAFLPLPDPEPSPWALEGHRYSTLVTLEQAAAYAAPGAFEEGEANTVTEEIPPFAFRIEREGITLGHLYSTERGELTDVPLRLPKRSMSNFAACADTRFGKSVVCERLVIEAVREWRWRAVVLDFGLGWRKLMRLLPADRFALYGLAPQSPRPIRWNPLQIGRRILPEAQLEVTCELLASAGRMGPRQLGFLRGALRELYIEAGVLVNDREVLESSRAGVGVLTDEEAERIGVRRGARVSDLTPAQAQALAVERSKRVDFTALYARLKAFQARFKPTDPSFASIEGVLLRLAPFTQGRLARMYGAGEGSIAIEDLALPWGLAVLEGGLLQGMEYVKAVVLGLASWHIYTDAVARKSSGERGADTPMILLFEEGNKVLSAGGAVAAGESEGKPMTSEIFQGMFRDAGKYNIFLGVIAQSPSELPPGILSSCNVAFIGQLKHQPDVEAALSLLGRSPSGIQDVGYLRFIESMPQGMFVGKFGIGSFRRSDTEPFLFRPAMVQADMPSDQEIAEFFEVHP